MNLEVDWNDFSTLTMAHELKAPLSLLRQLSLNLKLAKNKQEEDQIKDQIIRISEQSITQIEDLLEALRSENSLFELEPVNPRALCNDVIKNLPNSHALKVSYRNQNKLVLANTRSYCYTRLWPCHPNSSLAHTSSQSTKDSPTN